MNKQCKIPLIFFIAGEIFLFVLFFFIQNPPYHFAFNIDIIIDASNIIQLVSLPAGIAILGYSFIRFINRYYKTPTEVRLLVLNALGCFIAFFILKLLMIIFSLPREMIGGVEKDLLNRYFFNMTTFFMALSIYYLTQFGLAVFFISAVEKGRSIWRASRSSLC